MRIRLGLGPVFALESRLNARRRQVYAGRAFFVSMLLAGMVVTWSYGRQVDPPGRPILEEMAEVGRRFFYALTGIQLTLVLLAAPASAAGTIGMDRARGSLVHLLVTDLDDREIVLGSLAARLSPVFGMIACGVPVVALAALLGGIDFAALAGAFVVSLSLAVLGCSIALTLSIWATKTHEVLMAVYAAEILWLLSLPVASDLASGPLPAWAWLTNPFVLVFAPYHNPGTVGVVEFGAFVGAVLAVSTVLLTLSIARMRRVVVGQSGRPVRPSRARCVSILSRVLPSWPAPSLDGNPVLWREWHRNRPSGLGRRLRAVLVIVTWSLAAWGTYGGIVGGVPDGSRALQTAFLFSVFFGQLMLGATVPTTLAEERQRGSLDVLMTSPLSTRAIVVAKWWGAYRDVLLLFPLVLYASVFLSLASVDDSYYRGAMMTFPLPPDGWDRFNSVVLGPLDFLASGAWIASVGLLLAVWVRRMGRAVTLGVIAYLLMAIGWGILIEVGALVIEYSLYGEGNFSDRTRLMLEALESLSPLTGPSKPLDVLRGWPPGPRRWRWAGLVLVIAIKGALALSMLELAVRSFDRRLGRVAESPRPRPGSGPAIPAGRAPGPSS